MLGYVTMGLAVAPMVAPSIGGQLQEYFDWTAIFWFMAALGLGCLAVTWRYVPETNLHRTPTLSFGTHVPDFGGCCGAANSCSSPRAAASRPASSSPSSAARHTSSERMLHLSPGVYGLWFAVAPVGYASGNFISGRFTERFGVARMILAGSALALRRGVAAGLFFLVGLRQRRGALPADDADRLRQRPLAAERDLRRDQRAAGDRRRGVRALGRGADRHGRVALGDRRRGARRGALADADVRR